MKYIKEPIRAFIICLTLLVSQSYAQTQTDTGKENEAFRRLEAGMEAGQYEVSAYNTACYFALGGKPGMAFTCLRQAIGEGFSDLGTLETDTDLSSLHNDPRWPGIVKGVKNNQTWGQDLFFNKNTFWDSKTFRTPYQQNISENEKIAGLSKFWSEAKYNFVNFDLVPAINFDSLYFAYLPKKTVRFDNGILYAAGGIDSTVKRCSYKHQLSPGADRLDIYKTIDPYKIGRR